MKLYIDTTNREETTLKLNDKVYKEKNKDNKSQNLLFFIQKVLKKNRLKFTDLKEVKINEGPGSFTGLRVSASIAQAINYAVNKKTTPIKIKY